MDDRFGGDPHVPAMREAFSRMEEFDRGRVRKMEGISPFDPRLALLREKVLYRHLRAVARAGPGLDVGRFVDLYKEAYEAEALAMGLA